MNISKERVLQILRELDIDPDTVLDNENFRLSLEYDLYVAPEATSHVTLNYYGA